MTTAVQAQDSAIAVLRNRKFLALWIAQVVTQVGANMVLFGLTVEVYTLTQSSTSTSLLILSFLVPAVIFGAIAGVFVDRIDRRLILIVANAARGGLFLLLLVIPANIIYICTVTALVSTLTTFFGPAESAMIPAIVPRRQMLPANSLFVITLQASFFLGFALLGPLMVNISSTQALLVIVGVTYFIGAALCWILPPNKPQLASTGVTHRTESLGQAGSAVRETFAQLADGVRFIVSNTNVFWPLTYLAVTASLIGVLGVLGPGFATHVLGLSEKDFVIVVLPLGVGLIFGILVLNVYGRLFPRRRCIEGGLIGLGLSLVALSLAQPLTAHLQLAVPLLLIVIVVAFTAGIGYAFVAVPAQTQLQEELPSDVRGRVFGVLNMLVSIASFVPIIIVGPIADSVGTNWVVFGSAVVVLIVAAGSILAAQTTAPGTSSGALVDAMDPVALSGRSLTSPIRMQYVDDGHDAPSVPFVSIVVPGQPGPAEDTPQQPSVGS